MGKSESEQLTPTRIKGRQVGVDFAGGQVSSDGGLLLVREVDRRLGLIDQIARGLTDPRESGKVVHENETMLRQRVVAMIAGWEDLNDAATLRTDPVHRVAAGSDGELAVRRGCAASRTDRTERRHGR